jgi:hypothetical protein
MRELRTYGFVRGVLGDRHPYRDSHSVFSNMRSPESDGNPLNSRNSNQIHVQPTPHLFLALFTAKIYQLLMADSSQLVTWCALSCRRLHNFLHAKQALICGPNMAPIE